MVREKSYLLLSHAKYSKLPLFCLRFERELAPSREARILWRASALIIVLVHIIGKEDEGRHDNTYHIQEDY